jgi:hypothetical protein
VKAASKGPRCAAICWRSPDDLQRGSGFDDHDEIHVTVFVHPSSEKRAACGHGHETLVSLQPRQSRLEERGVQFGQVTPAFKVVQVCLAHQLSS